MSAFSRILLFTFALALPALALPGTGRAETIVTRVSVETQTMHVYIDGQLRYEWPVSTARAGKYTPRGEWSPQWLSRWHRSSRYNNAPMFFAIFYDGDYAIHATDAISRLGRPASAGCIRLHPDNAALLFAMVQENGMDSMRVIVVD